jgi:RNA polymerase subunit RPABC4/transcription elongation factor Spt4
MPHFSIELVIEVIIALFGAFFLAFWLSLIIWTFRDVRSRSRDIFAQLLATLMVIFFNVPGLVLYFMLRPQETLAATYERALEEEALLQDIEERYSCPGCKQKIRPDFQICPSCHTRLKRPCPSCERLLQLQWNVCPYCGATPSAPGLQVADKPRARTQPITQRIERQVEGTTVRIKEASPAAIPVPTSYQVDSGYVAEKDWDEDEALAPQSDETKADAEQ